MNVLQICHKPPVPSKDGGCLAMDAITQGLLSKNVSIKVLTISTPKHTFNIELIDKQYIKNTRIESVFKNTDLHPKDALISLLKGQSYNVSRFYDEYFETLVTSSIKKEHFDIVHLESIFVLPYLDSIRECFAGKIVVRTHNVEHRIWENLSINERNPIKKKYLKILAQQLKKYESVRLSEVDGIVSISDNDTDVFTAMGCNNSIKTVPFGISIEPLQKVNNKGLFFLGSLDWQPNIEGVNWLSKMVSSALESKVNIVGRNPSKEIMMSDNLILKGEVDDAQQFMKENGIMLVPLFSGSGIRIKILEAMAWGIPVVATPKAVEGLGVESGRHMLITDDPAQFANFANQLLKDKNRAEQLVQNAYEFVQENYNNNRLTKNLIAFYNQLLIE